MEKGKRGYGTLQRDKKKYYIIIILTILFTWGVIFWQNLEYKYEPQGDAVRIENPTPQQTVHYEAQGNTWHVTGEDPQMIFAGGGYSIGAVLLELSEPVSAADGLPVQIFYAKDNENYTERHSYKTLLKQGESACMLPVSQGEYALFRLDIDGDFSLAAITFYTQEPIVTPVISEETLSACLLYFPAAAIAIALIFWAHGVRAGQAGFRAYAKEVLGGSSRPDREVCWDYLRVLAALLVILAHACSPMVDLADADWKRLLLVCGLTLGLSCNVIYVMLSGALLLGSTRQESVGSFYIRRASKVIIPLIAYYLLLLSLNDEVSFLPPEHIGDAFKRILSGAPDVAPHLWLIYTIVALYLITPFFRVMVQHLSDSLLLALAVVILLCNALTLYLPLAGITFGVSTFLAGWTGVFLLGYIMTRDAVRKYDKQIIITGVIAFAIAVIAVFCDSANMNYVYNAAVTLVLLSCAVFALALRAKGWLAKRDNALLRLCSRYSYAIILIHWYALFVIVEGRFHVTALRFGCIGGIAATVLLAFAVSLLLGIVYDNTVVIMLSVLFDKLVNGLKAIRHKNQ